MPKKKMPTPRERLFSIYKLAGKPRYLGAVSAKDATAAIAKAKTDREMGIKPADHFRLVARAD